jgi:hypothetical protein
MWWYREMGIDAFTFTKEMSYELRMKVFFHCDFGRPPPNTEHAMMIVERSMPKCSHLDSWYADTIRHRRHLITHTNEP